MPSLKSFRQEAARVDEGHAALQGSRGALPSSYAASQDTSANSHAALQRFLVLHYDELKRRLVRHLGCPDLAGDSLHDTWLRLADGDTTVAIDNPNAYVFRMACHAAIDRMRSEKLHHAPGDVDAAADDIADTAPGPADIVCARSNLNALSLLLTRMPTRRRELFLAVRLEERPQRELAARYGISLRMVERELQQAKGSLRAA